MNQIIYSILALSLSGTLLMLTWFLLRPLVKKHLSATWQYYLWLLVLLRFLVPAGLPNDVSGTLIHWISTKAAAIASEPVPDIRSPADPAADKGGEGTAGLAAATENKGNLSFPAPAAEDTGASPMDGFPAGDIAGFLPYLWIAWLAGALLTASVKISNYRSFVRYTEANLTTVTDEHLLALFDDALMDSCVRRRVRLYQNSLITTPMLTGLLHPQILLPAMLPPRECLPYILKHELCHLKRQDLAYKWLLQLVCCLHWFNPFLRMASREINKLCEESCDEAVIAGLDGESRSRYGNALLHTAELGIGYKDIVLSTTLIEHKKNLKERLTNIMYYHKKSRMAIVLPLSLLLLSGSGLVWGAGRYNPEQEGPVKGEVAKPSEVIQAAGADKAARTANAYGTGNPASKISDAKEEFDISRFPTKNYTKENANKVYDDDSLIAGYDICSSSISDSYIRNKNDLRIASIRFTGSQSLLIVNAKSKTSINLSLSYTVSKGKFKLLSVAPDNKVSLLPQPDDGGMIEIPIAEGRNVIKMVGKDNCHVTSLRTRFTGLDQSAITKVYPDEWEEMTDLLKKAINKGQSIPIAFVKEYPWLLDQDTMDQYLELLMGRQEKVKFDDLIDLCPFASGESLGNYVKSTIGTSSAPTPSQIEELAPFIEASVLGETLESVMKKQKLDYSYVESLAPFIPSETINLYLTDYCDAKDPEISRFLLDIAPFASSKALSACVLKAVKAGTLDVRDISRLAPFLPDMIWE